MISLLSEVDSGQGFPDSPLLLSNIGKLTNLECAWQRYHHTSRRMFRQFLHVGDMYTVVFSAENSTWNTDHPDINWIQLRHQLLAEGHIHRYHAGDYHPNRDEFVK